MHFVPRVLTRGAGWKDAGWRAYSLVMMNSGFIWKLL